MYLAAATAAAATALVLAAYTRAASSQLSLAGDDGRKCISQSSANPISSQWPTRVTGNLNGTTIIVPIPFPLARKVIPSEYEILQRAYQSLLPGLLTDKYPMMVSALFDHDVMLKSADLSLVDFSRAALEFPFVDRLRDGYSSFRWTGTMLITEGSEAINGSEGYGIRVHPARFDPVCDAYKDQGTFTATASKTGSFLSLSSQPDYDHVPYPLDFIRNITNQPAFATSDHECDNYIRLFNTSLTETPHGPVPVRADVKARLGPLTSGEGEEEEEEEQRWDDVYGWRLSTAFIEPPLPVSCQSLQGYSGTGPGD
ncbi:hypothetical protein L249_6476 [Ophiocordyceps polyrhachis-furcata BCC 54312]|uniref:Uncharacterized protein n=1 Tax=Ophiocordyceps polyrhachis-furcata BCC 54312 TaxID=1330021 RepID=A0A367LK30_9HYPO|nr:hypothetical protein L249_6476 [Ophiocordyceps polyrhachis-furcata BCC 54312]